MNILKKIICSISILTLLLSQSLVAVGFSQKEYLAKEKIMSRSALHKVIKGRSYSKSLDALVEKLKDDEEKMWQVNQKVEKIIASIEQKNSISSKEEKTLVLLDYLHASLEYQIFLSAEQKLNAIDTKIENIIDEVKNSDISENDKNQVEDIFVNIQKSSLDELQVLYSHLEKYIEEKTNYQAKWEFNMNYDIDNEVIWKYIWEINFDDYVIENSFLDSRIKWELEAVIESIPEWKDALKEQISSSIDLIQKNGGYYALLEDLEITTSQENEMIQEYVQRAKDLAQENKYLEISDAQTQEFYELLSNFNSQNFFADLHTSAQKSFFTAYKKIDETYYIIPTQYACDSIKSLSGVFDPFAGKTCSESQYDDLLKNFLAIWEITLETGKTNIMKLVSFEYEEIEKLEMQVEFNESEILSANFIIAPDQSKYAWDKISLEYQKNNFLNGVFSVKDLDFDAQFTATLDRNNNFETIDFNAKSIWYNEIISSDFTLNNRNFSWNFSVQEISNSYDENWEVTGKEVKWEFKMNIQWEMDYSNDLESMNWDFSYSQEKNEIISGDFIFDLPQISLNINAFEEYSDTTFTLNFDSKYNSDDHYFYEMDLDSKLSTQPYDYDYQTWERINYGEIVTLFETQYEISNGNIDGEMFLKNMDDEILLKLETNGRYSGETGDIKNIFTLNESLNINSQIKKARNSSRINNIRAVQMAVEQSYQDNAQYPSYEEFEEKTSMYLYTLPKDEFAGKIIDGCKYGIKYEVADDQNGIENQIYSLSTCLEKVGSWEDKLTQDDWIDDDRYEVWAWLSQLKNEGVFIHNINNWENYDNTQNDGTPVINYDVIFDYTNNKTDIKMFLEVFLWESKAAEMNFENTGTIKYAPQNIQKPEKTAPLNELLY